MIKRTSLIVCLNMLVACQQQPALINQQAAPTSQYMSSIAHDGTSVVIKLANGQQRTVTSNAPSYSATIGAIHVQGKDNQLVINASTPTVSAGGTVTGSGLFKPTSPEGAHWHLIKLNGQAVDIKGSQRPPYLRMSANKMQGLTGCNVMSGFYNRNQQHNIQFIQVQGTTQHCPQYQSLENDFIAALQKLRLWKITADYHLQFLDEKQQVLAEFIALSP